MPRAVRNPRGAILSAFAGKTELGWTKLWTGSTLSKSAFSNYLNKLIKEGYIETRVDTEKRPPTTLYRLVETEIPKEFHTLEGYENLVRNATILAYKCGIVIAGIKDRDKAKKLLERYVRANLTWIGAWLSTSFILAWAETKGYTGIDDTPKASQKKIGKGFGYLHKTIRRDIQDFLEPWVEALADAYVVNYDIAHGGRGIFAKVGREFSRQIDLDWLDVLEEHIKTEDL